MALVDSCVNTAFLPNGRALLRRRWACVVGVGLLVASCAAQNEPANATVHQGDSSIIVSLPENPYPIEFSEENLTKHFFSYYGIPFMEFWEKRHHDPSGKPIAFLVKVHVPVGQPREETKQRLDLVLQARDPNERAEPNGV